MTSAPSTLHPAAAASLAQWHSMVSSKDLAGLDAIIHPEAVFRSPVAFNPYGPAPAMLLALRTAVSVFEDFTYHRELSTEDGLNAVLEFSAKVGDKKLKGIDMIRFDESGRITEFEVMVRPLSGLQALATEMGARLSQHLPAFKIKA